MVRVIFVAMLGVVIAGCGGPKCVPVKGTVKYLGKPVGEATVTFYGKDGVIAQAATDAQGNFAQVTWKKPGDGLPVGDYTVTITPKPTTPPEDYGPQPPPPFPQKYLSMGTSDLKISVTPGMSEIVLELKD